VRDRHQHFSKATLKEVYWKSCRHEGYLNIYIYRKLALPLAVGAARLGLTPNQVTVLSFLCSLAAVGFLVTGNATLWLWALVPFHAGKILDCADGQLAKLTNQTSALGAFLDPFFDRIIDAGTLLALAIGTYVMTGKFLSFYLVIAILFAWYMAAYLDKYAAAGETSLDNLRSTTKGLPLWLRRFVKWDGGFTGLITTLAIVFHQAPLLIGLFLLVTVAPIPMQFRSLYTRLRAAA
jgi:phosphatidylglycerophosphate synthase